MVLVIEVAAAAHRMGVIGLPEPSCVFMPLQKPVQSNVGVCVCMLFRLRNIRAYMRV